MEEAKKLIGTGKKHLVMGKVVEAVGALQEACGLLAKKYGDTADECGEAFFWCGRALLDLARMENSVLGNALEGVPEEDEDEGEKPKDSNVDSTENMDEKTRDELRAQVYDAMAEKTNEDSEKKNEDSEKETEDSEKETEDSENDSEEKKGDVEKGDKHKDAAENVEVKESKFDKSEEKMETEKESGDEEEEDVQDEEEEGEEAEMEGDTEGGEGDAAAEKDSDDDDDEVVGNLQLSWEMLEVAKVIYKRKESKEDQLMAAQTYLKLGEVSSESGNYTQAMEDFQECLKLQVKHLDPDSRLLAETHYQLGLTYALNLQYSQAIEELNSSSSIIKSRLDKLKQLLEKAEGPEALPEERKEMEELKALLPEIQEKVEDATEGLKTTRAAAAEGARGVLDGGSTSSAFPGSTALPGDSSSSSKIKITSTNGHASKSPASDISHLVRKKRKPEESPVKEEGVTKKLKQNDGQANGH